MNFFWLAEPLAGAVLRNLFADGEVPGAEAWEQLGTCKLHGAAGCEPWEHQRGFSCQINEILVLPMMFDALRTRLRLERCQEQALWVPAARLGFGACPAHRMHAANAAASQQQKRHLWKCHRAQEGEAAPPARGESTRALVQRQRVSRAGALFNRESRGRGEPFPQMSAKHRAC